MYSGELHLTVQRVSVGNCMVLLANINDTVLSIHEQIEGITGIPISEQRLMYNERLLEKNQSLLDCSILDDELLHLVDGMSRTKHHPKAWHIVHGMVSLAQRLCRGEFVLSAALETFTEYITHFLLLTMKTDFDRGMKQLRILSHLSAPAALVMLYRSPIRSNSECASDLIKYFIELLVHPFSKAVEMWSPIIVLEFCNLLRRENNNEDEEEEEEEEEEDSLYLLCRTFLASRLRRRCVLSNKRGAIKPSKLFPIVNELAKKLSTDLSSSILSIGPSMADVRDFTEFSGHLRRTISKQLSFYGSKHVRVYGVEGGFINNPYYGEEAEVLYNVYRSLFEKMDACLEGMEGLMGEKGKVYLGWSRYLPILKELSSISRIFDGVEEQFWTAMRSRKSCICELILRFRKGTDDHDCDWIFCRKDAMASEFRSHYLSMLSLR